MLIRHRNGRWSFDRRHGMRVLGLYGTGTLRRIRIRGVVPIERGGVFLRALETLT
jgi:hypothetical protein